MKVELCYAQDASAEADSFERILAERSVDTVGEAASDSNGMVLLLSPDAAGSEDILSKVQRAVENGTDLYPVFLSDIKLPGRLHFLISNHQWLNVFSCGLERAAERITTHLFLMERHSDPGRRSSAPVISPPGCRHFTGRRRELDLLEEAAGAALDSEGPVLMGISGMAGVGKTSLIWRFLSRLGSDGKDFIAVSSDPVDSNVDFILWAKLIEKMSGLADGGISRDGPVRGFEKESDKELPEEVAFLLPLKHRLPPAPPEDLRKLGERVADYISEVIRRRFSAGCRVLCIDNMHWTDSGSMSLLKPVLERLDDLPLTVLFAYRPLLPDGSPLSIPVPDNCTDAGEISLAPLNRQESLTLLKKLLGSLPDGEMDRMVSESGGWPLHLELMARNRIHGEDKGRGDTSLLIRRSFERLPVSRKILLEGLAVLGGDAITGLVIDTAGIDSEGDHDFLLQDDDFVLRKRSSFSDRLVYRQGLLREAVYKSMDSGDRNRMHLRAAVLLEERYAGDPRFAGEICGHYQKAERYEKAFKYASAYLDHMNSVFHSSSVVVWAERAEQLAYRLGMNRARAVKLAEFLQMSEEARGRLGDTNGREETLDRLMELAREYDMPERLSSSYCSRAYIRKDQGRYGEARQLLDRALEFSGSSEDTYRAAIVISSMAAIISDHVDCFGEAEDLYLKALRIFRKLGKRRDEGVTETHLGILHLESGSYRKALEHNERSQSIFREIGYLYGEAVALTNAANIYAKLHDRSRELRYMDMAATIFGKAGDTHSLAITLGNRANTLNSVGRLQEAHHAYIEAIELHLKTGNRRSEEKSRTNHAHNLRIRGLFQDSLEQLARAEKINRLTGNEYWRMRILESRARCLIEMGRIDEAEEILGPVLDLSTEKGYAVLGRIRNDMAACCLSKGRYAGAISHCDLNLSGFEGGFSIDSVQALALKSDSLIAAGSAAEALLCSRSAVDCSVDHQEVLGRTAALASHGRALAANGENERSRSCLMNASEILDECGFGRLSWFCGTEEFRC